MGIMDKMRQRMGIIMIMLVVAFLITIVFNWGAGGIGTFMGGRDVVGSVNGEKINIKSFYEAYNAALEQYRNAGVELDAQMSEMILQQTWETLVSQILWDQELKRLGVAISDEELYHHLEENPPEFLKNQEVFLTDGVFDYRKYLDVLRNPQGNEWLEIEKYLRSQILPYQKLNNLIMTSVVVDEHEVLNKFIDQTVVFSVNYLAAPVNSIPDSLFSVYDEDMKAYYEKNKENYKQEERRSIRVVYWPKVPSARDSAAVLDALEDLVLRHREGESFDELSQIFSEVQDEEMVGDLGWFKRQDIRPEYRAPVFNAKAGEILDPVIIGDEYHLIKVNEKRMEKSVEEAKISLLIRRIDPLNTYDYYATEAEAFVLDVESYGFTKAYENVEAKLDTIRGGFTKEFPFFGDLGYFPALAKWAYRSKTGELSPVYENSEAFVVAELFKVVQASYMPLEDVETSVRRGVIAELKKEKSKQLAEEAYASFMRGDVTLSELAETSPYYEYKNMNFTLNNVSYPFGSSPAFADVVRNLNLNTVSPTFSGGRYGSVFVQLTGKSDLDEDLFMEQRNEIQQALVEEKQQTAYENWMNHLRAQADIKDYRVEFGLN